MHKIVENYILYESIGAGQYGKVYRAKNTKTNETVAVKTVPLDKFREVPKLEEFTANEIKTLNRIKTPNVVKFIEMLKTTNNMYLVYEFCDGGTLEDLLQKKHHLTEIESLKYFQQLLNAFKAIYKENILHRDLKPSNILLHNGVAKIADFGFCKKMSGPQELTFTMVGSPIYMAPEVLKGYPYNVKADIWSLGVVLYELLYGICPYEEKTLPALIGQIDSKPLTFHPEVNPICQNTEQLLRRMLTHDHKARIEWSELVDWNLQVDVLEKAAAGPSLSLGGGPMKLNLEMVNQFDEQYQFKMQTEEKIVKTLMKERNRVAYVSNVLHSMLEMNISNKTPIVGFVVLKKLHQLLEGLRKDIAVENTGSKFRALEKWNDFQNTDEFLAFSRYVNEELEEATSFINIFKQEINVLISANPNDNDLKDPVFKMERLNTNIDMRYLHGLLTTYAEEVKNLAQEKIRVMDENEAVKLLAHANDVLDIDNLDEFFEKTLDTQGLKLTDQAYFNNIKRLPRDKLQDTVSSKLSGAKLRIM
jgi:serine/threonine-protein kinase ULK/ATG1